MTRRVRVLIIDDSASIRALMTQVLSTDPELEVVGTAVDPFDAREKIRELKPDVLTLDIEMPKMDGITFLKNLMRLRPMPVVMVSTLTERGADVTMAALEIGAVDFFTKPRVSQAEKLNEESEVLISRVKSAARANLSRFVQSRVVPPPIVKPLAVDPMPSSRLIAIGASTGGTEAVSDVLRQFPPLSPGTVIAQHIPEVFSERWAARMNEYCQVTIKEATNGEVVLLGHVYIAPGGKHLRVVRRGTKYVCAISDDAPVNRHRPSVDVLFDSVLEQCGTRAVAALLTGMGADGARGLERMRAGGLFTIAQNEATSVVWGMPGEAVKRGAACEVLPLERIAERLLFVSRQDLVARASGMR